MKKLLKERLQELAGIKPLHVNEQKPNLRDRGISNIGTPTDDTELLHRTIKVQVCEDGQLSTGLTMGNRYACVLIDGNTPQVGDWFHDTVGTTAQLQVVGRVHTVYPATHSVTIQGCNPSNVRYNHPAWQPQACPHKDDRTPQA